jgi:plasmid stabilization system protein ParE
MHIQWTQRARRQFLALIDTLLEENPSAAERTYDAITDSLSRLATFPEMGRRGRVRNTRELVIPSQPYIVAYRI